ncbi:hypothetical protein J1N35_010701 [Gossypium stocksii]|uniref:Uncharacterized protein n=1 Tax=Gossypium stocksii TaxID=47602 RepID=A0A9D4ACJ0_9ROSI|nr:hypothetical protein J1N35_010701 [Gossypium stocksii]
MLANPAHAWNPKPHALASPSFTRPSPLPAIAPFSALLPCFLVLISSGGILVLPHRRKHVDLEVGAMSNWGVLPPPFV